MEASELRIGNYYKWEDIEDVFTLTDFHNMEFENDFVPKPILLTEEWLIKFGFEFCDGKTMKREKGFVIKKSEPHKSIYIRTSICENTGFFSLFNYSSCNLDEIQFIAKVDYVHQLQNLYFALVGEELTAE